MLLVKIYLIGWFLSKFEPLQDLIDYFWSKLPLRFTMNRIIDYFYVGLGCQKCLTLWIGLSMVEPFSALGLSFIAWIQEKLFESRKK